MLLVPTARLACLVACGAAAMLPGWVPLGVAFNLAVALACLVEAWALPGRSSIALRRRLPRRVCVGREHTIELVLRLAEPRPAIVHLRDTVPAALGTPPDPPGQVARPGRDSVFTYRLTPPCRGRFELPGATIRLTGRLGLLQRQIAVPLADEIRVYPDLGAITRYDLLQRAGRLVAAGIRSARLRGAGTEFESLRDYRPDDEPRRIDWRATARRGRVTSRQYEVDRSQTLLLCLDVGRLMTARLDDRTRLDHAISAALLLADVALRQQDRVGLVAFCEEPLTYLPPAGGRGQMTRLLESTFDLTGRLAEPDYGAALRFVGLRQRKRSLVVVFSDLVDANASSGLVEALGRLRPAHLPVFVSLRDPALHALARTTDLVLLYERALAAESLADRGAALGRLRAGGVRVVDALPAEVPAELVNRYVEAKVRLLL